jgi:hypothetical protein
MRELVESVKVFYLLTESGDRPPSSEIEHDEKNKHLKTKLTKYAYSSKYNHPNHFSPDYSGTFHGVSWNTDHDTEKMDKNQKIGIVQDAIHLQKHFVKNVAKPGDVLRSIPDEDDDGEGGNKRGKLYQKVGFGKLGNRTSQYGIIKQHPHDHDDETKRGQHYLHPLEHEEIELSRKKYYEERAKNGTK